ncbi:MAG: chemotaxis protein CheX [Polyangiaceae bacterium]
MIVGEEQISTLTNLVWTTVLKTDVKLVNTPGTLGGGKYVAAKVDVIGTWNGTVTVGCSHALARRTAGKMFDVPPGDISLNELRDAVGEIANIVGGNVKTLIAGKCRLSLPTVAEVEDQSVFAASEKHRMNVWFEAEGERFVVQLVAAQ